MWTPAQRSARLLPPARTADRPVRGVPGSEFVLPRASASGCGSPSAASTESFSKLSESGRLGRGLLGPTSPSGSVEEREAGNSLSYKGLDLDTLGMLRRVPSASLRLRILDGTGLSFPGPAQQIPQQVNSHPTYTHLGTPSLSEDIATGHPYLHTATLSLPVLMTPQRQRINSPL